MSYKYVLQDGGKGDNDCIFSGFFVFAMVDKSWVLIFRVDMELYI